MCVRFAVRRDAAVAQVENAQREVCLQRCRKPLGAFISCSWIRQKKERKLIFLEPIRGFRPRSSSPRTEFSSRRTPARSQELAQHKTQTSEIGKGMHLWNVRETQTVIGKVEDFQSRVRAKCSEDSTGRLDEVSQSQFLCAAVYASVCTLESAQSIGHCETVGCAEFSAHTSSCKLFDPR
jgi:hypothetical protein